MTQSERQRREIQRKASDIIMATEKLIAKKGIDDLTVDDIALSAEFSKRTIYKYFTTKEEIIAAVSLRALNFLDELLEKYSSKEKLGINKIISLSKAYIDFYKKHPQKHELILYLSSVLSPQIAVTVKNACKCLEKLICILSMQLNLV